jgi:thiamine biosynthesis lipoprotein
MSKKKGWYQLPNDAEPLFAFYKQLYKLSKGRVTPLVGQLLSDTGYDASYSFKTSKLSQTPSWEEAIEYKYPVLIVKKPILLDIGAAGKGYLIDIVSELIQELNITKFSINAGGDILNHNASKELTKIGLENPVNLNEIVGIATLTNGSICGSAGNRRSWGKYNHIVDPKTKESPSHLLASWVLADTAMLADGLATALFFTEPQTLNSSFKFEYALIRNDLSLECSSNFPADFFIEMRKVSLV